jgi:NAD-dependent dihydropyrimidine dehydrogenase PreA subunit
MPPGGGGDVPQAASPPQSPGGEDELEILKKQAAAIGEQMEQVQERIRQLESSEGPTIPKVDAEKCSGCGACIDACPVDAIRMEHDRAVIDEDECIRCSLCADACLLEAISVSF